MAAPKADFPELSSERLRLRALTPEDLDAFHELMSIPEVTRFSNWPDAPKKTQMERSLKWIGSMFHKGNGCGWGIEDRISGQLLGGVRLHVIDQYSKCAQLGYELNPSAWGRGLMSEAVDAVLQCGFGDLSLNRIEAWTLPGNPASDRVLEKSGFRYEGTLRQKARFKDAFHDFRMFGCLAGER
ncbi:GNAT family N-acetyltransferase [Rhizobium sp. P38BS-XIX]|uniref:GNAT family N-acetyltransferase n=1 Tax=Rhizobium sp. P38BS-XIX TaxID=2726740 RepID=UPI0014577877|nr:GNAT family protein [Rhizobium sp. P38BS-XIX]NLR98410.1 GNAT family N-acetyltransferase [Rhizobium sp. P38BS-XIX]